MRTILLWIIDLITIRYPSSDGEISSGLGLMGGVMDLKNVDWLGAATMLVRIGLGAFLISQGQVAIGIGMITGGIGQTTSTAGLLPKKIIPTP